MKYIRILIFLGIAAAAALAGLYYFNAPPRLMRDDIIRVAPGDGVITLAHRLKDRNLIESRRFFSSMASLLKMTAVKPGKYKIPVGITSFGILSKLNRGDIMKARLTIPEGFNIYQIAERLEKLNVAKRDDILHLSSNTPFLRSIGILASSAEGYLFPDTYIFPEESDPKAVLKNMHERLNLVLGQVDLSRMNELNLDRHRLLTMASLIEKEAKIGSERPQVSAVFHNRMKKRMKLDCDPTVRYAVKRFTGPIYLKDLRDPSPYNTYIHPGLPPTPICSPGKAAITAALNPAPSDYLYFVARNDGSHFFSRTYREHARAVNKYQRGGNGPYGK